MTAPLTWFSATDDFEDKDSQGKRRRLVAAPAEPSSDDDERAARNKRMRIQSPPKHSHPTPYLDPPTSVFYSEKRNGFPSIAHSELVSTIPDRPLAESRSTLSPMRHLSISRTMSIDPPVRPLSREASFTNQSLRDISMNNASFTRSRDLSLPPMPVSARPSFRMRTSMTPQPQQQHRELSEPPPINTLISNPIFIHGPPPQPSDLQQSTSAQTTLGSLAETVRVTRSPIRQHSSLLFGATSNVDNPDMDRQQSPAERVLHELDVYRTPLLPSRLRSTNTLSSSSITASSSGLPDMFKSRRGPHLILMQDNKPVERLGRKVRPNGKPAVVNETKPYAGEGGMKKFLARRKLECEEDQEDNGEKVEGDREITQSIEMANMTSLTSKEVINPIPPSHILPQKNSADFASSSSSSGSSLRVGRAKTSRNHINRPVARPSKTKFSAVFEDDGDDAMGGDDEDALKEKEILNESARNAPVFNIPAGFSFAKETKPIEHDLTGAKEPPITSLPFSFSKTVVPRESKASAFDLSSKRIDPSTVLEGGNSAFAPASVSIFGPSSSESTEPARKSPTTSDSTPAIPNFFAMSSVLSKPIEITQTTTLTSANPTSAFSTDPLKPAAPVKDAENPFWDGESKKDDSSRDTTGLFGGFSGLIKSATTSATLDGSKPVVDSNNATISVFSGTALVPQVHSAFDAVPTVTPPAFSFDKPPQATFTLPPSSSTATNPPKPAFGELSKDTNILVPSGEQCKSEGVEAPKLKDNLFAIETHKNVNSFEPFGAQPKSTPSVSSSSAPSPFLQVAPTTNLFETGGAKSFASTETPALSFTTKAPADAPKPLFSSGFSFGEKSAVTEKIKGQQETPFSFGAPPSTPPTATDSKKTLFSFGSPAPSVSTSPAPVTFSFSGGGSTVADVSNELFSFGTPSAVTPADRPVTPPKSQDHEFRMEESPTREMQQTNGGNGNAEARPTLSFSFNSSTSAPLFGGVQPIASPVSNPSSFSFGSTTSAAGNPFAPKETKPQFEGFGQMSATPATTFNFNQVKAPDPAEAQRPATTGSFSFNTTPTSATGSAPFSFAAPSNPFGQSQAGSAPSSPSTFNQPSPFAFGPSAASASTAFSFGSQPASPAGGNVSLSLPQVSTSSGFGGGSGFGAVAPPSPFSGPVPLAPSTSSGGTLFTIGAAPVIAPPGPGGPRQIRKLPNRRGGAKR